MWGLVSPEAMSFSMDSLSKAVSWSSVISPFLALLRGRKFFHASYHVFGVAIMVMVFEEISKLLVRGREAHITSCPRDCFTHQVLNFLGKTTHEEVPPVLFFSETIFLGFNL